MIRLKRIDSDSDDQMIAVNPAHIVCVLKGKTYTSIELVLQVLPVKVHESFEEVLNLIAIHDHPDPDVAKIRELMEAVITVEPMRRNGRAVQVQQ